MTSEDEERIIDRITNEVVERKLETIAIMFLESVKPLSYIGSQFALAFAAPFLSLFGDIGIDYIKFFDKRENVERLLKRIEGEVKTRDEEKTAAKTQSELIAKKFGFRLDLLPGFSIREDATRNEFGSGTIGIVRKESHGGGFVGIYFTPANSSPSDFLNEFSSYLSKEETRQTLMLTTNIALSMVGNKQDALNIKGHKVSTVSYNWSDNEERNGLIECYGLWCNKTNMLFILGMRTRALTGEKKEQNQVKDLKYMINAFRCH